MRVRCTYDKIVPISELKLNPKNRNIHPPEQIRRLAEILNYQGWRYPVKVSLLSGLVTSGHGRIEAAKLNNWTGVPVNFQEYDNTAQEFADLTADNAIALWAELDEKGIGEDYKEFELLLDSNLLGLEEFNPESLNENQGDPDEVPEVKDAICQAGELWILGEHRLLCGDSTKREDVERLMGGEKADMVFTDPPYGVNYDGGHAVKGVRRAKLANDQTPEIYEEALLRAAEACNQDAPLYLWFSDSKSAAVTAAVTAAGYQIRNTLIWNKNMAQFGAIGAQYKSKHEPCLYCFKVGFPPFWDGPTNEVSVWDISRASKNEFHPTQKPVELAERAIGNSGKKNGIILDLFLGSGSTLIACEKTNRKCYGMEIDPHYCDIIIARWEKFTGKKAVKCLDFV